ncbi:MAG: ATP-binding cassette domain-containing protein [Armatimonadetes bacterium]|nr:ATP-binding cassette domain-containing protein [Armatimonadota bacterium]MDW8122871.1 ATP-binding cassette domain-containing protein [Armatimonadota bacterium]
MDSVIVVDSLVKHYVVHERSGGLVSSLVSLFRRKYRTVRAVDGISFQIDSGEVVGFLGPNGAGKTTTLKVLAGLLLPTAGRVRVLGYDPFQRHPNFLRQITLVAGQRWQLQWDLPAIETFLLHKALYDLSDRDYQDALDELVSLLDISHILYKPVRQLSLGERMRCELAVALLHRPSVLFLDEPTLGLDVLGQAQIRHFIRQYNQVRKTTILLTSHYMDDVSALCKRVMVINHGKLIYDGDLIRLQETFNPTKVLSFVLDDGMDPSVLSSFNARKDPDSGRFVLEVPRDQIPTVASQILSQFPIRDLTIEEPPIENLIARVYQAGVTDVPDPKEFKG